MPRTDTAQTRQRILDAAERTFAEQGFEPASIRTIAARARVTLPVLYYHFESKTGLIRAVLLRRLEPIRQIHQSTLAQLAATYPPPQTPPLRLILESMIRPALDLATTDARKGSIVMRLLGRVLTEPAAPLQDIFHNVFADVRQGFLDLLGRCLPHLPKTALYWRHEFIWGALALLLCNPGRTLQKTEGLCNPLDTESLLPHFLSFCIAGLEAPPPATTGARPDPNPERLSSKP
jgi:AcrR family transcriptional regulator